MARFAFPLITRGGSSKISAKQISSKVLCDIFVNKWVYSHVSKFRAIYINFDKRRMFYLIRWNIHVFTISICILCDGISWTNRAVKIFTLLTDHLAHHSNLSEASRATIEQFRREMGENRSRGGEVALTGFWRGSTIREVFTIHSLHLSSVSRRKRKKEERETRDFLKLHRSRKDQNINHAQHPYNMSY